MLGAAMPAWTAYFGTVSATLLVASLLAGIVLAIRSRRGGQSADEGSPGRVIALAALAWLGAYALLLFLTEAANPELWVMALAPLALVYAVFVVGPLSSANRLWPAAALLILLGAHNFAAGLLPLMNPAGDYNRAKSEWLLSHARPVDMILTAGNPVFERFLRYHSPAPVVYLYRLDDEQLATGAQTLKALSAGLAPGGRLLLTGDIFDQPPSLRVRFPQKTAAIDDFAAELGKAAVLLHDDKRWPVYAALPAEH
jgi:hypothetical protein